MYYTYIPKQKLYTIEISIVRDATKTFLKKSSLWKTSSIAHNKNNAKKLLTSERINIFLKK